MQIVIFRANCYFKGKFFQPPQKNAFPYAYAFRHFKWLPCASHIMNTILSDTFKCLKEYTILDQLLLDNDATTDNEVQDEEVLSKHELTLKGLITSYKELVAYFKRVGETPGMSPLKQDVETRWNSKLLMLQSILKEKCLIQNYFQQKSELARVDNKNFELVESLCLFLEPSDMLEGDSYITFSQGTFQKKLELRLQDVSNNHEMIVKLKNTAL